MQIHLRTLLLALVAVFAPLGPVIATVMVLVIADFVLGVMASRAQKVPFQSSLIKKTVLKFFVYETALILGFLVETYLTGPAIPASKIVASFIGLTEFTSIVENLNSVSGTNLLKVLVSKLGATKDP